MHDEDKFFVMRFLLNIYINLKFFVDDLEPQSSIYFFGLYGSSVFMFFLSFSGLTTTYKFPLVMLLLLDQYLCASFASYNHE